MTDKTEQDDAPAQPGEDDTPELEDKLDAEKEDSAAIEGDGERDAADPAAVLGENAELKDRLLRTMADMENLRRRTEREKHDATKYAITQFANDVLAIADSLERTLLSAAAGDAKSEDTLRSLIEGVQMTEREMLNVLSRHGIEKIEPAGDKFDPNLHQAIFEVDNPDMAAGLVVEVVQAGYKIRDRVLRPATVGISKGGEKAATPKAVPDDGEAGRGESAAEAVEPPAERPPEEPPEQMPEETVEQPAGADKKTEKAAKTPTDPAKLGKKIDKSA